MGYIEGLINSVSGYATNLDRQKIAVVYNTSSTVAAESEAMADYYIAARGLNTALKHPIDLGASNTITGGDYQTGDFYLNTIVPFAAWCVTNNVQGVICSIKTMNKVNFTGMLANGNDSSGTVCAMLAACHYFVEEGGLYADTFGAVMQSAGVDISENIVKNLSGELGQILSQDLLWYDDVIKNPVLPTDAGSGVAHRTSVPFDLDYRLCERPYAAAIAGRYQGMPFGRIGHPSVNSFAEQGWTDSYDETVRLISDALLSENRGYIANKTKKIVGVHYRRTIDLNVHSTAITTHVLRNNGWDVVATVGNASANAGIGQHYQAGLDENSTVTEVLDANSVVYTDFSRTDFLAGTARLGKTFLTCGQFGANLEANSTSPAWAGSVTYERGGWHMVSTSNPSATLGSAIVTGGACAGIAGTFEPLSGSSVFLGPTLIAVLRGSSLMEGFYAAQFDKFTVNQFPAGDPLYAPYKRHPKGAATPPAGEI